MSQNRCKKQARKLDEKKNMLQLRNSYKFKTIASTNITRSKNKQ